MTESTQAVYGAPVQVCKSTTQSKDRQIAIGWGNFSDDDPVRNGGGVRILSANGGFEMEFFLPAENWSYIGKPGPNKGYRCGDDEGPIDSIKIKTGRYVKVKGRGAALYQDLGANPNPVYVFVNIGQRSFCGQLRRQREVPEEQVLPGGQRAGATLDAGLVSEPCRRRRPLDAAEGAPSRMRPARPSRRRSMAGAPARLARRRPSLAAVRIALYMRNMKGAGHRKCERVVSTVRRRSHLVVAFTAR